MVEITRDVLTAQQVSDLVSWFDADDAITVKRLHSHRSKEPIWEQWNPNDLPSEQVTKDTWWPRHTLTSVIDQVITYDYEITQVNFQEVHTAMIRHRYGRPMIHADTLNPFLAGQGKPVDQGHAILIPLRSTGPASTCWFSNHWHGLLSCFNRHEHYEFKLTDADGREVFIDDLREMLAGLPAEGMVSHAGGTWHVDQEFRQRLVQLIEDRAAFLSGCVSDYSGVIGYDPELRFDEELRQRYFPHIPRINLDGLTVEQIIQWRPGDCYVWPRTQLHAATYTHDSKTLCTIFVVPRVMNS